MFKFLIAVMISLSLLSYKPNNPQLVQDDFSNQEITINLEMIRHVTCISPDGLSGGFGTAVFINDNMFVTAAHVSNNRICRDTQTGTLLTQYYVDEEDDIALLTATTGPGNPIRFTCERFRTGQTYFTLGYVDGQLILNRLVATDDYGNVIFNHLRRLNGLLIPGQSGGPIIDENGIMVGINNVTNLTREYAYSRELADTVLCENRDGE